MHHPNQLLGTERLLSTGAAIGGESPSASMPAENTCARDRVPTITTTVEVPARYSFGAALDAMHHERARITRAGWNARGQYVELQVPDKGSRMTLPYAVLRNANGDLVPWVPSQGDLFANDWAILPR